MQHFHYQSLCIVSTTAALHVISTCRVKYKLRSIYSTKDLPVFSATVRKKLKWSVRGRHQRVIGVTDKSRVESKKQ